MSCILNDSGYLVKIPNLESALVALNLSSDKSGVFYEDAKDGFPNTFIKINNEIKVIGVAGKKYSDLNLYLMRCAGMGCHALPKIKNEIITISGEFVYNQIQKALNKIAMASIEISKMENCRESE